MPASEESAGTRIANQALIREGIEAFNTRDWGVFDRVFAADHVFHNTLPGLPAGPAGARELAAKVGSAWPDEQWTIEQLVADDETVVVRILSRATHGGKWYGMQPTGTVVTIQAVWIFRLAAGQVQESWWFANDLDRLRQIGVPSIPNFGKDPV